jgi:hypothetical protein
MRIRGGAKLGVVLLGVALILGLRGVASADVFVPAVPDPSWTVNGTVYAVETVGDRVFVGGQFTTATSSTGQTAARANLAAFSADTGELLTDWQANTVGAVIALKSDGTSLWVGGSFTRVGTQTHNRLAKVSLATGAPDATFAANANGNVRAIDVDGASLYVGGTFTTMNSVTANRLAKVNAGTGALDTSFTASTDGQVNAVRKNPVSSVLYVAGDFGQLSGASRIGVGAVSSTTGANTGLVFANGARPTLALDVNTDGTRLFAGQGGAPNSAISWNTTTGVRQWRQVADGDIQAIRYFNGTVYFGFHDGFQGDHTVRLLAADEISGLLDPDFRPSFDAFWGVYTIAVSAKGVFAGGTFTNVAGVPAQGWVRFRNAGAPPPPPPPTVRYLGSETAWSYWDQGTRPAGWETPAFDSSTWAVGTPQLGYGDGDETSVIGYGPSATAKYLTTYFRTSFTVGDLPEALQLGLLADDGAAVYLNGTEVVRDNLPTGTLTNTTRATIGRSGGDENAIRPFTLPVSLLHAGTNQIAVELHQDSTAGSDASFDADLTGQMSATPPPGTDPVQSVLMANGASWQWRYAAGAPAAGWNGQAFDASTWNTGNAMLGWGNTQVATPIDTFTTTTRPLASYFRRTFDVVDRAKVTKLTLHTYADDGVVVYVNGTEVARKNMPAGTPTVTTYATTAPRTAAAQAAPLDIDVPPSLLVTGQNVIAVETHLNYRATPDLTFQLNADITAYP